MFYRLLKRIISIFPLVTHKTDTNSFSNFLANFVPKG